MKKLIIELLPNNELNVDQITPESVATPLVVSNLKETFLMPIEFVNFEIFQTKILCFNKYY